MIKKVWIWILILLSFSGRLSAQSIFLPKEPLTQRLDHISKKYRVWISYDRIQLKDLIAPQIRTQDKKASVLLEQSLQNSGFTFRQESAGQYYIVPVQKGNITGVILDAESGQPLPGVSISIKNNLYASSTDGSFNLTLESGIYSIVLNAVGYESKEIRAVHIEPGQALRVTLTLLKKVVELTPVSVVSTIEDESVRAFYARQKNAMIITDGLADEQIKMMPDRAVSQIVKHINGVNTIGNTIGVRGQSERYSQVLVDGIELPPFGWNKRDLALDLFPKEMISEVVMAKTATADAPSGFSGGQLHIRTLGIPRQNFTSFTMATGGNTQSLFKTFDWLGKKGILDFLGVDDGTRKRPGIIVPGKEYPVYATIPNNEIPVAGLVPSYGKAWPDYNAAFSMGRAYALSDEATLGFVFGTSLYRQQSLSRINTRRRSTEYASPDSIANAPMGYGNRFRFLSGTGTVFNAGFKKGTVDVSVKNFFATQLKDDYSEAYRTYSNASSSNDIKELLQEPEQYLMQQHQLNIRKSLSNRGTLEYFFAFTRAVGKIMDRRYLQYFRTTDDNGNAVYNTPNIFYGDGLAIDSRRDSGIVSDNRSWIDQSEQSYSTGLSFSRDIYTSENFSFFIKSGWTGIFRRSHFSSYSFLPYSDENEAITGQYDQLLDPKVNSPMSYWAGNTNGTIYSAKMNNQAFYFLSENKLYKHLRLSYGLRAEYYNMRNDQRTYLKQLNGGEIPSYQYGNGITGEKKRYWLPSANLFFNTGRKTNLRAAYFKTVLHPSARELSYYSLYEPDMDGDISGRQLLSTTINNYDLRWEWFPSMQENVSASLFYKRLKNPVELVQGVPSPYSYSYINQYAAHIAGLEIEARKSLAFIAPQSALKHLTLQASYTLNRSKVEAMSLPFGYNNAQTRMPSQDRPLFNQAPWTFDASLSYDDHHIGFFAFYNTSGPKTYISNTDPNLIEYENGIAQLDMSFYIKCLKGKGRITFNVLNLLNPWHFNYVNPSAYKQTESHYWKLVNGSVKYSSKDGDVITYRIKQGINMSIGMTIDF